MISSLLTNQSCYFKLWKENSLGCSQKDFRGEVIWRQKQNIYMWWEKKWQSTPTRWPTYRLSVSPGPQSRFLGHICSHVLLVDAQRLPGLLSSATPNSEHRWTTSKNNIVPFGTKYYVVCSLAAVLDYLRHCSIGSNFLRSFEALENMCFVLNISPSGESWNWNVSVMCEWEMHGFPGQFADKF